MVAQHKVRICKEPITLFHFLPIARLSSAGLCKADGYQGIPRRRAAAKIYFSPFAILVQLDAPKSDPPSTDALGCARLRWYYHEQALCAMLRRDRRLRDQAARDW